MDRFSRLCSRFFGGHLGFSIRIDDVTPSEELLALKRAIYWKVIPRYALRISENWKAVKTTRRKELKEKAKEIIRSEKKAKRIEIFV